MFALEESKWKYANKSFKTKFLIFIYVFINPSFNYYCYNKLVIKLLAYFPNINKNAI